MSLNIAMGAGATAHAVFWLVLDPIDHSRNLETGPEPLDDL